MLGKNKKKGLFKIAVWVNENEITSMAKQAEALKLRRVGIPVKVVREHGFNDEWNCNTDGISKYLKYCHEYYIKHEAERLEAKAKAQRELEAAREKAKQLGLEG